MERTCLKEMTKSTGKRPYKPVGKSNNPEGRPRKKIDVEMLGKLASFQCTMEEMADILECSVDLLEMRYSDVIKAAKSKGKASLRRQQWRIAEEGSATMAIFLGKVILKQKDSDESGTTINYYFNNSSKWQSKEKSRINSNLWLILQWGQ